MLAGLLTPNSATISQHLDGQDMFHVTVITVHHFVYFKANTDVGHMHVKANVRRNRDIEKTLRARSIHSAMVRSARNFKQGVAAVDVRTDATLSLKKVATLLAACSVVNRS